MFVTPPPAIATPADAKEEPIFPEISVAEAPNEDDIPPFDVDEPIAAKPAAPVEAPKSAPQKAPEAPAMPRGKIDVAKPEGEIDLRNLFENP